MSSPNWSSGPDDRMEERWESRFMSLLTDGPAEGDRPSCSSAGSNDMLFKLFALGVGLVVCRGALYI